MAQLSRRNQTSCPPGPPRVLLLHHTSLSDVFSRGEAPGVTSPAPFPPGLLCTAVHGPDTRLRGSERGAPFPLRCMGAEPPPSLCPQAVPCANAQEGVSRTHAGHAAIGTPPPRRTSRQSRHPTTGIRPARHSGETASLEREECPRNERETVQMLRLRPACSGFSRTSLGTRPLGRIICEKILTSNGQPLSKKDALQRINTLHVSPPKILSGFFFY